MDEKKLQQIKNVAIETGGESTKFFALALIAGILAGTYSSIFFAAPMLVTIQKIQEKLAKNSA